MLSEAAVAKLRSGHCPDCNHRGFVLGPRALGTNMNIECGGCGNRFNVGTWSWSHHIIMADRIPRSDEGGGDWT